MLRSVSATSLVWLLLSSAAHADSSYHIGNSLTWDMYMPALPDIAASFGASLTPGYHIRTSHSLVYILNNPSDATIASPSIWPTALPSQPWTFVAFEPYPDPVTPSTLQTDITAAQTFIGLVPKTASPPTVFFIYEAWPDQNAFLTDYDAYWNQTIPNDPGQLTLLARQYFDALLQRLTAIYGKSVTVRVIPVGDVLDRIDQLIAAGQFVGATSIKDFYRDTYHMGQAGRFMAAITALATMYGHNPTGAPWADYLQFNDGKVVLDAQMAAQLEGIVWDVLTANTARTGVDSLGVNPLSLDFGPTAVAGASQPQTIVISNTGSVPVTLNPITASGSFLPSSTCGTALAEKSQCSVSVVFAPTLAGSITGTLSVGSASGTHSISLSGSAPVTVSLSASASTATVGTPITLTWKSQPGASCQAQSSAQGSPWSGNLADSGTQTFTESGAGAVSYSVSCSAAGVAPAVARASLNWSQAAAMTITEQGPSSGGGGIIDLAFLFGSALAGCSRICRQRHVLQPDEVCT